MDARSEKVYLPHHCLGYTCKFSDYPGPLVYRTHTHRELEFNLLLTGTAGVISQKKHYELVPGSIIWYFPDENHGLITSSDDFDMWVAYFDVDSFCRNSFVCPEIAEQNPKENRTAKLLSPEPFRILHHLLSELRGASEEHELYNSGLSYLLNKAWRITIQTSDPSANQPLHPAVLKMIGLLNQPDANAPLAELASLAGLSYSRISRVFRQQIGQSIMEYRDRIQVERFMENISRNRYRTVLDCALESGFGSYAQFYRVFKKQTGINPGQYISNLKNSTMKDNPMDSDNVE